MLFGELTADVQAQARARHVAEVGILDSMESLEHKPVLGLGNSDSVVGHAHDSVGVFGRHGDRQPWRAHRVGQPIVDQVVQDSTQLCGVGFDGDRLGAEARRDLRIKEISSRAGAFDRVADHVAQVDLVAGRSRCGAVEA